jgi:hypothetical protein
MVRDPARPRWRNAAVPLIETSSSTARHRFPVSPDAAAIAAVVALLAAGGLLRQEFIGDGLRHLPHVLESTGPALGEPRWLLFPALLFVVVRPWVALGLVSRIETAVLPFLLLTLVSVLVYLLSIRRILIERGHSPSGRALGLAVAFASAAPVLLGTDIAEPLAAAAIAVYGLTWAVRHQEIGVRRGVLIAVSLIASSGLVYQGTLFAVFLLPAVVPWRKLLRRDVLPAAAVILALIVVLQILILVIAGDPLTHAWSRVAHGEENVAYRSFLRRGDVSAYIAAVIGGFPQALVFVPEFHGLRGVISKLRAGDVDGAIAVGRLVAGWALLIGGAWGALRRRDWALVGACAGLGLLPLLRHQQYGYVKFYVLVPVVVAMCAAVARGRNAFAALMLLVVLNVPPVVKTIADGRLVYAERRDRYAAADPNACWMAAAWAPRVSQIWPGTTCAFFGSLTSGHGPTPTDVSKDSHAKLDACLRSCFCEASAVYTDDFRIERRGDLDRVAAHFGYDRDVSSFLWRPEHGTSMPAGAAPEVLVYSRAVQSSLCDAASSGKAQAGAGGG